MNSLALLGWIVAAVLLQLGVFLVLSFARHWTRYRQLQEEAPEAENVLSLRAAASTGSATPAWTGWRRFRVTRRVAEDPAGKVVSFHLAPEDRQALPAFLPGQFLTFQLDLDSGEGVSRPAVRCYSLSAAPQPDHYRISVKRVPGGRVSAHFHDSVQVGSVLQVRAPTGHFVVDGGSWPVVLLAGGIGITPLLCMASEILSAQPGREVWLFYSVRSSLDCALQSELEALATTHENFHLHLCFSDPLPDDLAGRDDRHSGRVSVERLRLLLPLKPFHFFICGPAPMMEALVAGLEDWGVAGDRIHFEAFGPASAKRRVDAVPVEPEIDSGEAGIRVTFAGSGRTVNWQTGGANLLALAEDNGISVPSGCRSGSCGSCQTIIRAGEVSYPRPPDYDPEPGSCLLCVSVPETSITLEA